MRMSRSRCMRSRPSGGEPPRHQDTVNEVPVTLAWELVSASGQVTGTWGSPQNWA